MNLETAVKTNILTGVSQTCGEMQLQRAKEMGCDLMELSAHSDSRPSHQEWQGKIVSLSGREGYLSLDDIGYGKVDGFKGINCRHDWLPYFEGTAKAYTDEQLEKLNNTKVTYNGKEISLYEAEQLQRKIEKKIINDKSKIAQRQRLLKGIINEKTKKELKATLNYHKAKLALHREELKKLSEETNLRIEAYRTKIAQDGSYNTQDIVKYAKKLYNKGSKKENLEAFIEDEVIRKHIRKNPNLQLNKGAQDKHIVGANNYNIEIKNGKHPSIVDLSYDEIEELINKYAGTGGIVRNNGTLQKEVIIADKDIGTLIDSETGDIIEKTNSATIHYKKDGKYHIVPTDRR